MSECRGGGGSWESLQERLDDTDNLDKFTDRIEHCMRMREKVNIKRIVERVTVALGKGYGNIADRILRRAASQCDIKVVDDEDEIFEEDYRT
jgi:hypothetical protein